MIVDCRVNTAEPVFSILEPITFIFKSVIALQKIRDCLFLQMLGVIAGIGNGFTRVLKVKNNLVGDFIPVDYPINLLIAVAWFIATRR
jgi:hypothetical protein